MRPSTRQRNAYVSAVLNAVCALSAAPAWPPRCSRSSAPGARPFQRRGHLAGMSGCTRSSRVDVVISSAGYCASAEMFWYGENGSMNAQSSGLSGSPYSATHDARPATGGSASCPAAARCTPARRTTPGTGRQHDAHQQTAVAAALGAQLRHGGDARSTRSRATRRNPRRPGGRYRASPGCASPAVLAAAADVGQHVGAAAGATAGPAPRRSPVFGTPRIRRSRRAGRTR